MSSIISFLLTDYRQKVLNLLLLHPGTNYHVREIARLTHTTPGSLHRELSKLAKAQVLIRKISGNQVYYQANINFLIYKELASILKKTSGIADVLANALMPIRDKINVAFIFGSVGSGNENINSDIDLLIIGDLSFIEVVTALHPTQTIVRREINPKVYSKLEWKKLLSTKNIFTKEIMKKPKIFIFGDINDIK